MGKIKIQVLLITLIQCMATNIISQSNPADSIPTYRNLININITPGISKEGDILELYYKRSLNSESKFVIGGHKSFMEYEVQNTCYVFPDTLVYCANSAKNAGRYEWSAGFEWSDYQKKIGLFFSVQAMVGLAKLQFSPEEPVFYYLPASSLGTSNTTKFIVNSNGYSESKSTILLQSNTTTHKFGFRIPIGVRVNIGHRLELISQFNPSYFLQNNIQKQISDSGDLVITRSRKYLFEPGRIAILLGFRF